MLLTCQCILMTNVIAYNNWLVRGTISVADSIICIPGSAVFAHVGTFMLACMVCTMATDML